MPTPYDKSSSHERKENDRKQEHERKEIHREGDVPEKERFPKEGEAPSQLAAIAPGASIPTSTTLAAFIPLIFTNKSAALVDGNLRVTAIDAQSFILDWGTAQQPTAAYLYVQSRPVAPNTIAVQ
jgi:hypothetical protein